MCPYEVELYEEVGVRIKPKKMLSQPNSGTSIIWILYLLIIDRTYFLTFQACTTLLMKLYLFLGYGMR